VAIEQARVGEVAAQMMDTLEQQQYGEDAEITDVMLIAAVDYDDNGATTTETVRQGVGATLRP
jgi:pyruvate kinase